MRSSTPLSIISGRIQLLLMAEGLDPKVRASLEIMREQVQRIANITDGLLRFSRRSEPRRVPVDINEPLEGVLSLVEPQMKLENIEVIKRLDPHLPQVRADGDQLGQVFMNLITNARDAMPQGGKLTVTTGSFWRRGKEWVRIEFSDTGCGIPEGDLDRIFDPFFTTKAEGEGVGLGLSICHGIVEDHGGKIRVESRAGVGSTFIIELPTEEA